MRVLGALAVMLLLCHVGGAQTPSPGNAPAVAEATPAGATARCNDGSYSKARQKWQACGGHKGVQTWFAAGSDPKAAGGSAAAPVAASGAATPAAGDAGKVWENRETKVYHCAGTKFYGKTKNGEYMSEADAKKAGARPDRGKPCGS